MVGALCFADFNLLLTESGSGNIDWNEIYGDTMLSENCKKLGLAFYGLQMLYLVAHSPGDLLLETKSNSII